MNDNKLSNILSQEEYEQKRTPEQLNEWVETVDSLLRETNKRKRFAILESGVGKKFIREIHPLNIFAQHYYKECVDIFFQPKTGNQSFDAQVFEREKELHKIEITEAVDGKKWGLQKELLLEKGWAPETGKIDSGNTRKHNRKKGDIQAISEGRNSCEIFKENLTFIEAALQKKSRKQKSYGSKTLLLLVFDDYTGFDPNRNEYELKKFVWEKIHLFKLNFHKLFLIGWSGESFYEFPIGNQID